MSSRGGDAADLAARLEPIQKLTEQLVHAQADSADARAVAERIKREVEAARASLKVPKV
jgi:hypothetical protein